MAGRERMQRIAVVRVGADGAGEASTDDVAVEAALEIRLNGEPFSVAMRSKPSAVVRNASVGAASRSQTCAP